MGAAAWARGVGTLGSGRQCHQRGAGRAQDGGAGSGPRRSIPILSAPRFLFWSSGLREIDLLVLSSLAATTHSLARSSPTELLRFHRDTVDLGPPMTFPSPVIAFRSCCSRFLAARCRHRADARAIMSSNERPSGVAAAADSALLHRLAPDLWRN